MKIKSTIVTVALLGFSSAQAADSLSWRSECVGRLSILGGILATIAAASANTNHVAGAKFPFESDEAVQLRREENNPLTYFLAGGALCSFGAAALIYWYPSIASAHPHPSGSDLVLGKAVITGVPLNSKIALRYGQAVSLTVNSPTEFTVSTPLAEVGTLFEGSIEVEVETIEGKTVKYSSGLKFAAGEELSIPFSDFVAASKSK